jgi:hypothetical protein
VLGLPPFDKPSPPPPPHAENNIAANKLAKPTKTNLKKRLICFKRRDIKKPLVQIKAVYKFFNK